MSPQGSVLGPVLFVLFICNLPRFMEPYSQGIMFADDTVLINNDKEYEVLEISTFISTLWYIITA